MNVSSNVSVIRPEMPINACVPVGMIDIKGLAIPNRRNLDTRYIAVGRREYRQAFLFFCFEIGTAVKVIVAQPAKWRHIMRKRIERIPEIILRVRLCLGDGLNTKHAQTGKQGNPDCIPMKAVPD